MLMPTPHTCGSLTWPCTLALPQPANPTWSSRKSSMLQSSVAPMVFTPVTAFSPKMPPSPPPAIAPALSSSARRPQPSRPWVTKSPRAQQWRPATCPPSRASHARVSATRSLSTQPPVLASPYSSSPPPVAAVRECTESTILQLCHARWRLPVAKRLELSAMTHFSSSTSSTPRATLKSRSWPISTATLSTWASANAHCSDATRRSLKKPPAPCWMRRRASESARPPAMRHAQ